MTKLAYTLAALVLIAAPAVAQTPESPHFEPAPVQPVPVPPPVRGMTLEQVAGSPAWQAALVAAAKAQFAAMPGACAAAHFQPTTDLTVFQPADFGPDGKPFAGAWTTPVGVSGCGPARLLNVLTIVHAEGEPTRVALMPGNSHADPVTQKAALQYAQAVAGRAQPPGCRQQAFTEAVFVKYDGAPDPAVKDGRDARPWVEQWMLVACGTTYSITMRFKPNASGTQLAADNPVKVH